MDLRVVGFVGLAAQSLGLKDGAIFDTRFLVLFFSVNKGVENP